MRIYDLAILQSSCRHHEPFINCAEIRQQCGQVPVDTFRFFRPPTMEDTCNRFCLNLRQAHIHPSGKGIAAVGMLPGWAVAVADLVVQF